MLELMKGNFEEDENGIGLSLSLSIGGNYTKKDDQICNNSDDKMLIECQRSKKRALHREMMENEELVSRKSKISTFGDEDVKSLNLFVNQDSCLKDHKLVVPICDHRNVEKRELMKKNCGGFRIYNSYQCRSSESNGSTITERQSSSPKGTSRSNVTFIEDEQDQKTEEKRNCGMIQLLYRMPCVSATGNGPNGKTIDGLLCKYDNKMEINIVCVCHGKSFTPSQFVEHAGGVDLSQPLKHITVTPPCF
ncbi:ninja-family protein AFP3-like [Solanum pennellii]|uniref:Ninja-family protein n=1 Tax=Solanum pennellii TaxID=28526 RepID=A0ABM1H177_SOLPN|nr:ninja-family protein AFP3-like [Solanum pennellii]